MPDFGISMHFQLLESINQSINQSKHICTAPYAANESKT